MHHFTYRHGILHAEDVSLKVLAQDIDTPFYCYSTATLQRHYKVFDSAFAGVDHQICYAMKANSNQAVIKTLIDLGAGVDVVSEGEMRRAFALRVPGRKIVFSGVGKTAREMALGLKEDIDCFNVESRAELELLSSVATRLGGRARVSFRVNPDVDIGGHEKISTGRATDKFGVPFEDACALYDLAAGLPNLDMIGIDMHIGSQVSTLAPFERAYTRMAGLIGALRARGHNIEHADLGGGLGALYHDEPGGPPHPKDYADMIKRVLGPLQIKLILEPGRMIAANAGVLVARVIYVKRNGDKTFVVTDAAMNDLIRPTLYDARHEILPVKETPADHDAMIADVVGPVCESGDFLARDHALPPLVQGDLIVFMSAGAYGAVQSGTYNTRPLVPEVLVNGARMAIVRPRQTFDELIGLDRLAGWQTES